MPIKYKGHAAVGKDIEIFKAALAGVDVEGFMPVVAPASAVPMFKNEYYKSEEEALFALAEALREEYAAIVDAGLTVQVDDAFLPYVWDLAFAGRDLAEYRKWASVRVDALNHALKGLPQEKVRYHICWGSFNTPHVSDIPLKDIVDLVLRVKAGAYCIEMGNPRHAHEWRVWETAKLPEGRKLVPGVISHSTNVVEHPELVAERLVRVARLVGRENVMAGTDCGFAQSPHLKRVHPSGHVGETGGAGRRRAHRLARAVGAKRSIGSTEHKQYKEGIGPSKKRPAAREEKRNARETLYTGCDRGTVRDGDRCGR